MRADGEGFAWSRARANERAGSDWDQPSITKDSGLRTQPVPSRSSRLTVDERPPRDVTELAVRRRACKARALGGAGRYRATLPTYAANGRIHQSGSITN